MSHILKTLCLFFCFLSFTYSFEVIDCDICHRAYAQRLGDMGSQSAEDDHQKCHKHGKSFEEGETYKQSHLRYRCENGIMKIEGCYVDDNKNLEVDENFVDHEKSTAMKCYRKHGNIGFKEIFCGSVGFNDDFTACKSPAIGNGRNTECNICEENANLGKILTPNAKKLHNAPLEAVAAISNLDTNRCSKNGQFFNEGETYKNNYLRYKCENGIMKVKGCYAQSGKDLETGENYVDHENQSIMHCQKVGGKIGYTEVLCKATGFNKNYTNCKGSSQNSEKNYDTVSQHKVYIVEDNQGAKIDEEKVVHVDCGCQ